jgi:hypothetical protein
MAIGDRIRIGNGSIWDDSVTVPVYSPRWEANGTLNIDHFGACATIRLGGVKGGTTGTINGPPIRVHRTQLLEDKTTAPIGGVDLIDLFPIQLDHYMQVGWIPVHHLRIISGGTS